MSYLPKDYARGSSPYEIPQPHFMSQPGQDSSHMSRHYAKPTMHHLAERESKISSQSLTTAGNLDLRPSSSFGRRVHEHSRDHSRSGHRLLDRGGNDYIRRDTSGSLGRGAARGVSDCGRDTGLTDFSRLQKSPLLNEQPSHNINVRRVLQHDIQ